MNDAGSEYWKLLSVACFFSKTMNYELFGLVLQRTTAKVVG
jgi:hypothetical protein